MYPTFPAHRLNLSYEKRVLKNARQVITVGPSLKDLFVQKHRLGEKQVHVVFNGFDEDDFKALPQKKEEEFTITYVGTLSDIYNINALIGLLKEKLKTHPGIRLRFVGSVSVNQRRELDLIPSENVEYIPHVDHRKAIDYMARSTVLLLVIPEHSSGKSIVTGKIFEYLATGTPILGIGPPEGDSARIISEFDSGFMVDYEDVKGLNNALSFFLDSQTGQPPSQQKFPLRYSRKTLTAELAGIMDRLESESTPVET